MWKEKKVVRRVTHFRLPSSSVCTAFQGFCCQKQAHTPKSYSQETRAKTWQMQAGRSVYWHSPTPRMSKVTTEMETSGFPSKLRECVCKRRKREPSREDVPQARTPAAGGTYAKGEHTAASPAACDRAGQDGTGSGMRRPLLPPSLRRGPTPTPTPADPGLARPYPLRPVSAPERPLPSPWRCPARHGGRCPSARPTPGCRSWRPPWLSPFALRCPLPARMRRPRDGAEGRAEGTGWSRKRSRDTAPSMTSARGAGGEGRLYGLRGPRPSLGRPCCPLVGRTECGRTEEAGGP